MAIATERTRPALQEAGNRLIVPSTGEVMAVDASRYHLSMGVLDRGKVGPVLYPRRRTGKDEAALRTRRLGVSGGTDGTYMRGSNIYQHYEWHARQERFVNKPGGPDLFTPNLGYMVVAEVEETRKKGLQERDRVAVKYGNKTGHTLASAEFYVKLPDTISDEVGVNIAQFGAVCANAVSEIDVGEKGPRVEGDQFGKGVKDRRVLIMGGGPVGVWTAMFMEAYGASEVTVLDMSPERVDFLQKLGINAKLNKGEETTSELIEHYRDGRDFDGPIPIDCTGNPAAPEQLFEIVKPESKIYLMSYYAGEKGVRLNQNFHRKRLSLVDVQIQTQAPGYTRDELTDHTINLAQTPKYNQIIRDIVSHDVPITEAQVALAGVAWPNDPEAQAALAPYSLDPGKPMMQVLMHPDAAVNDVIEKTLRKGKVIEHKSGLLIVNKEQMPEPEYVLEMAGGYKAKVREGVLKVENERGELMFENASGSIELGDGSVISTVGAKITQKEGRIRMEVKGVQDQPDMTVEIKADEEHPGLRITQEITNTTDREININRFVQLDMQEGLDGITTDEERASGIGYMSWAAPIHRKVSQLDIQPDFRYIPQLTPVMDGGQVMSEAVHIKADKDGKRILIGHLPQGDHSQHQGVIEVHNQDNRIVSWNDAENVPLKPGETRRSEELMVRFEVDRNEGLEAHAKELASRIGFTKTKNEKPYVGICTWSWAFGKLQPVDVRRSIEKIDEIQAEGVGIDLMQIDDLGAERHPHGDWVGELNKFLAPEFGGLKGFTDAVHAKGKDAGVWMAPGFVTEHSPIHRKIMENGGEWYVKDANGQPMVEKHMWEGKIQNQYILDMTHPDVQTHMREQLQGLVDAGVDYIKLDFLYNLITPGERAQGGTSVEAYNAFWNIFDEVWGERKVNTCGAPFYKTAGKWGIRAGADVLADNAPQWYNPGGKDRLSGGAAQNSVIANAMRIGPLQELFQHVDPDSTVTRLDGDSLLTEQEVMSIVASNSIGVDAIITIGDNPSSLKSDQIRLLKLALNAEGNQPPRPIRFEHGKPTVTERLSGPWRQLTLYNWGDTENVEHELTDRELGMEGKAYVIRDLVSGNETFHMGGVGMKEIVKPHGARMFAVKAI